MYSESQIVAGNAQDSAAIELSRVLGGLPVTTSPDLDPGSIVVVVASDYAGPAAGKSGEVEVDQTVGTPGEDYGEAEAAPEIDAGGDGPRCVN